MFKPRKEKPNYNYDTVVDGARWKSKRVGVGLREQINRDNTHTVSLFNKKDFEEALRILRNAKI